MAKEKVMKNSTARRLKYLVLLQIGERFRSIRPEDKKRIAFKYFLQVLLIVGITAALYFVLSFVSNYFSFRLSRDMLVTIIFALQLLSIVSCCSSMLTVLYTSKENSILLAFPCKYNEIFFSKIIVYTIDEFKKSLFFLLPFLAVFGAIAELGLQYWLLLIPAWIMLCLFPIFISATISIPISYIKRHLQNRSWLSAIFVVIFFVGLFALVIYIVDMIPTPVRILAQYGQFINYIDHLFGKINKFAIFYNFFGNMLFGANIAFDLPVLLAIFIACGAICFLLAVPFYFKAASSSAENSKQKKHKVHKHNSKGLFWTFLRKEFTILLRTSSILNSAITVILFFPIISYVMNYILNAINTTSLGNYMTVAFNLIITLSLLGTHNSNCAMAISAEGSEFAVLKASPSNTMIISWAKLTVNTIENIFAIATTLTMLFINNSLSALDLGLLALTIVLFSMGHIFWSFQIDITHPHIADYVMKGDAVINNGNVAKAMVASFATALLAGAATLLLLIDDYVSGWIRIVVIAFVFFLARLYLYRSNLKVYFNDIQV